MGIKNKKHPWLLRWMRPLLPGITLLCLGTAAQAVLQVAMAALTRYVLDTGMAGGPHFFRWSAALLGTITALVLCSAGVSWLSGLLTDRETARLRHDFLAAAERAPGEKIRTYHSGALLSRAMDDVRLLCEGLTGTLPALTGSVVRLVAACAVIITLYPGVAFILLVVGACVMGGAALLRPLMKERRLRVRQAEERSTVVLQENLRQLELLQALGAEQESLRRYRERLDDSLEAKSHWRFLSVSARTVLSLAVQLGTGVLLIWGGWSISRGELSYGSLMSLVELLALFRSPVLGLGGLVGKLTSVQVAAERLEELLDSGTEGAEPDGPLPTEVYQVIFDHVTFSYEDDPPVLEEFSACFEVRDWVGLSGLSGRGKTTLFRLILGSLRPQSGHVYVVTDVGKLECGPRTRGLFAYVPQDFALFSGSVKENLLLVAPEADDAVCRRALEVAQAGFVFQMPAGMDTQVREQGSGLSMGQLQRVAIARAVLLERPVLLLDECTSALDEETERAVLSGLRGLHCGALVVTHHPEALETLDQVELICLEG